MYAKIFSQIFDSSICEDYLARHVFMDLLVLANRYGHVDMTPFAISRRTNVPIELVLAALLKLSAPDENSRTPDESGRRIVLLDDHRDWGWRIVNYEQYRDIRDEEGRKAYFREHKREQRAKSKESVIGPQSSTPVQDSPIMSTDVTYTDTHTDINPIVRFTSNDCKRLYDAYPRREGWGAAEKKILLSLKNIDDPTPVESLLKIVRHYAKCKEGTERQFIPLPATWFHQKRYLDNQKEWEKTR